MRKSKIAKAPPEKWMGGHVLMVAADDWLVGHWRAAKFTGL